jgi:hypothetical protein
VVLVNFRGSIKRLSRKPSGSFPPLTSLRFTRDLRVFESFSLQVCLHTQISLSCSSTPPQRLTPQFAAFTGVSCRHKATGKSTSLELYRPSAFADRIPHFLLFFRRASEKLCPAFQKSRPQGLATLSTVSGNAILGSFFQLPTLLGFYPSELFSFPVIRTLFRVPGSALALWLKTSSALSRRFSGFTPTGKAVSLAARWIRSGREPCSPGFLGPLRFSLHNNPLQKRLPFEAPLSPFLISSLTTAKSLGLRGVGLSRLGSFPPKRVPTRLAFLTDISCDLFKE